MIILNVEQGFPNGQYGDSQCEVDVTSATPVGGPYYENQPFQVVCVVSATTTAPLQTVHAMFDGNNCSWHGHAGTIYTFNCDAGTYEQGCDLS